ncbi:MAG: tetratricopeptide repeat protein [Deltaproteobacteria bacterium]|nr:tetratricopeptide repeat protein [Deltaproteobacteria bacterium]
MKRSLPTLVLLALVTLAVHGQVLSHEFLHYDDPIYVTGNPTVQEGLSWEGLRWAFTTTHRSNWFPLTWLSHMLDCQLFGLNPAGHHFTNLLLHVLNTLLLFALLQRMTGARRRSALVAALFAIHPLHVESVAWVAARKDVLSTFFALLATWFYAGYAQQARGRRTQRRDYGLALLFFAMGLMAKSMLVTLPFLFLLLDYWPLRRFPPPPAPRRRSKMKQAEPRVSPQSLVWEKLPLFALTLVSCAITFTAQRSGGSVAALEQLSLWRRLDNAVISYVAYVWKTIVPKDLCAFYPFPVTPQPLWQFAAALLLLAGVSYLAVWSWRERRYLAVGWLWYLGTLVPVIGLVQVGEQALADRYTYLPLIGLFIVLSWGAHDLLTRWRADARIFGALGLLLLAALVVPSVQQVAHWKNEKTLFQHAAAVTQGNFTAHNNLGNVFSEEGEHQQAIRHFEAALEIRPNYPKAHNNLANAYLELGESDAALRHFELALELAPESFQVHYNLARVLVRLGRLEEAAQHYSRAIELNPGLVPAYRSLGILLVQLGRPQEAERYLREAIRRQPDDALAHHSLGDAYRKLGRKQAAISSYSQALRGSPDDPRLQRKLQKLLEARDEAGKE